jgi:hypothetical protein
MRIGFLIFISCFFIAGIGAQNVNNKIIIPITQASKLRVDAGKDILLDNSGSVIIGESVSVAGGTPEYTFIWTAPNEQEYNERTPLVTISGLYKLIVIDDNNCSAEDSLTVNDYGTGITNHKNTSDCHIVVEPDGKLMITMLNIAGPVNLRIISSEGLLIYQNKINSITPEHFYRINPGKISSGVYLLSVQFNSGSIVKKFIVH